VYNLPVPTPREPETSPGFAFALRLTSLGAQVGLTFSAALAIADIASQLFPRLAGASFGIAGGTAALVMWRFWGRIFRSVVRS
jgi:hypothetical protein